MNTTGMSPRGEDLIHSVKAGAAIRELNVRQHQPRLAIGDGGDGFLMRTGDLLYRYLARGR